MNKKNVIAGGLVVLATCAVGLEFYYNQSSSQTQDKANLQKQAAASGMPNGTFDPKQMQTRMLDGMSSQLGLSSSQRDKVGAIQDGMFPAMRKIMENSKLSNQEKQTQMQKTREDQDRQIKDLLTPEQKSKYDTMQSQFRERMAQNRGGMPGGMPPGGPFPGGMPPGGPPPGGMPPDGMPPGGMPGGRPPMDPSTPNR